METLNDILLNLEPGYRVEFSKPFRHAPKLVMIRCRKDNLVKDIAFDSKDAEHTYVGAEVMLVENVKRGLAILNKEKPLPLDNSSQPWYFNPYMENSNE